MRDDQMDNTEREERTQLCTEYFILLYGGQDQPYDKAACQIQSGSKILRNGQQTNARDEKGAVG